MKKQLLFIVLAFAVITGYSQSYFEKFIEPEDGVFREAEYVVETEDHGFIISCSARYINQNGMLLKITADGEITNRLIFQINNKDLRYCGLYKQSKYRYQEKQHTECHELNNPKNPSCTHFPQQHSFHPQKQTIKIQLPRQAYKPRTARAFST